MSSYLRCDDLYGCHEAVSNDGHSQEHVHEWQEVDHSSGHLVTDSGVFGVPDRQQDARLAHGHLITLIPNAGWCTIIIR